MKKLILLLSLIVITSCASSRKSRYDRDYQEKRGYMILDQIYQPRNEKYFEQNLKKKYRQNKRKHRKNKSF